jgi:hypothetical protein
MPPEFKTVLGSAVNPVNFIKVRRFFFIASGVGPSPLYCGHFWPIVPAPDDR